jgi:hypothetical protein
MANRPTAESILRDFAAASPADQRLIERWAVTRLARRRRMERVARRCQYLHEFIRARGLPSETLGDWREISRLVETLGDWRQVFRQIPGRDPESASGCRRVSARSLRDAYFAWLEMRYGGESPAA